MNPATQEHPVVGWEMMTRYRARIWIVAVVMILLPTAMLVVRWNEPGLGQMPFGWQMHTVCWGAEQCP
jgi:hypothetical protein